MRCVWCVARGTEDGFIEGFGGKLGRDNFEGLRLDGAIVS